MRDEYPDSAADRNQSTDALPKQVSPTHFLFEDKQEL